MALLHWRKFAFFEEEYIDGTELNQLLSTERPKDMPDNEQTFVPVRVSCSSSGRGHVLLGDNKGFVYILDRHLKILNSFKANHKSLAHIKQAQKVPVFITCGSDQEGINPVIKFWNLEKLDRLEQPSCIKIIIANSGFPQPTAVTCLECDETLTVMLVGYDDGTIVSYQCDIKKPRRTRMIWQFKISDGPITGLFLRGDSSERSQQLTGIQGLLSQNWAVAPSDQSAFVSSTTEILLLTLNEKSFTKVRLDSPGCKLNCSSLINGPNGSVKDSLFAVARDNAVYFYQIDGRGPCLAFEGTKLALYRVKGYLVIVSQDRQKIADSNQYRNRRAQMSITETKRFNLNIYDINNKFIAHSSIIPNFQTIFSEWGQLFAVSNDAQLIIFKEKDTQTKLDILFRKNQFSLVIEIAKSHQNMNEDALNDIYKHYADYLYDKGDYDGSIMQYIKTIGRSEPSYVIKKFMNSQRINNLIVYLEALHKLSLASQEHTRLLLNCYSKLKNDEQLKQFIESYEQGNIEFDADIAIKVLRTAGFHEFAIYLAKKHKYYDLFFSIQMQDINDSLSALEYMKTMDNPNEMALYMKRFGRTMLNDAPDKTIEMIKLICIRSQDLDNSSNDGTCYEDLVSSSRYILPEEFFHIFVGKNDLFVLLLEQLVSDGAEFATKAVRTLLLELYLNSWTQEEDEIMKVPICEKIKKLLSSPSQKYNLEQALILCKSNNFDDGLLLLYERAGLYHLILDYYMERNHSLKVLKTCEQFGGEEPELYIPALKYFSARDDGRLGQILKVIEHQNIVPPLTVISVLLESKNLSLGPTKEYLIRVLSRLRDKILDSDNDIYHYKDDTEMIRQKIEESLNHQTVFKPSACSACKGDLDLPSVHFLCSHSYHQNCFHNYSAESDECPICVVNNWKLLDEIRSYEIRKANLNKIGKHIETSKDDPFITLAKKFGYGLF